MAFPTTGILDNFNRANEGPPPSASWTTGAADGATSSLSVDTNLCVSGGLNLGGVWGTQVGPDSEVYVTINTMPFTNQVVRLSARCADIGTAGLDGYHVRFTRTDANPGYTILIQRIDDNSFTTLGATITDTGGTHVNGNKVGMEVIGADITAYIYRDGAWSAAGTRSDSTYTGAGYLALRVSTGSVLVDDFGGGTVDTTPPAVAPTLRLTRSNMVLA